MALEASDLNDGQILAATTQRVDSRGFTQFNVLLPSGRKLCSEWIAEDHKKQGLRLWVDHVRGAAVADAQEEQAAKLAKARRDTPAPTGAVPTSVSTTQSTDTATAGTLPPVPTPAGVEDMARAQLKELDAFIQHLQIEIGERTIKKSVAEKQRSQWLKILNSLTEVENV